MSEVGLYIVMHYPPRGELSPEQDFLMQLYDELRRRRRRGALGMKKPRSNRASKTEC